VPELVWDLLMPVLARPSLRLALALLCLPALAGLLVPGLSRRTATDGRAALLRIDDWELTDLLGHLRSRGLTFRVVPTSKGGAIGGNAFLVRGERPWVELEELIKSPTCLAQWKGVVYCERARSETAEARVDFWGGACLRADPFLFFGDPEMRVQIRAALCAEKLAEPTGTR
jgi:hypothetical protein